MSWKRGEDNHPVAVIRYTPHAGREDVELDRVSILKGEIHLAGRSDRTRGLVRSPTLPTRKVLQSKFPKRKVQDDEDVTLRPPATALRSTANPAS